MGQSVTLRLNSLRTAARETRETHCRHRSNGAGKTTWARRHRDRLPLSFYNADSIAEGLGDANSPEQQAKARALVDREISEGLRLGESLGFESTWSGESRPAIVREAHRRGYETHAIFLGTDHPGINIARVRRRVLEGGHHVPANEILRRWTKAFENLLATWYVFDRIDVLDSTTETVRLVAAKRDGKTRMAKADVPSWASAIEGHAEH